MGSGVKRIDQAVKLSDLRIRQIAQDILISAKVK